MKVDERKRQVYLYAPIGDSEGYVSADAFSAALERLGPGRVEIKVNSPGGSVTEAQLIRQILRQHAGPIQVTIDSLVASAATLLLVEPKWQRVMAPGAMAMIHECWTVSSGNASDLERSARTLRKFVDQLVDDYGRVMDASPKDIRQFLADETWFTAKEAVAIGLADRIDESLPRVEPVEGQLVKHYRHAPAALRSNSKAAGTPKRDAAERKAARTSSAKRDSAAFEKALRLVRAQRIAKASQDRKRYERKLEVAQEAIRQGGDVGKALASVR